MDVLVLLLGCVDLLLFLLLAALQVASHVDVGALGEEGEAELVDVDSLRDEPGSVLGELLDELLVGADLELGRAAVELVEPNPDVVVNYIPIYSINSHKINLIINSDHAQQDASTTTNHPKDRRTLRH